MIEVKALCSGGKKHLSERILPTQSGTLSNFGRGAWSANKSMPDESKTTATTKNIGVTTAKIFAADQFRHVLYCSLTVAAVDDARAKIVATMPDAPPTATK